MILLTHSGKAGFVSGECFEDSEVNSLAYFQGAGLPEHVQPARPRPKPVTSVNGPAGGPGAESGEHRGLFETLAPRPQRAESLTAPSGKSVTSCPVQVTEGRDSPP